MAELDFEPGSLIVTSVCLTTILYCLLSVAPRPIPGMATLEYGSVSWTDTSRLVWYVQIHRWSIANTKVAWADARSGVASGIDQRGSAMENQAGASLRPQKEPSMANWGVSEG